MDIAYGYRVTSLGDELVETAERTTVETVIAGSPGSMLVDFFPICTSPCIPKYRCQATPLTLSYSKRYPALDAWFWVQTPGILREELSAANAGYALRHGEARLGMIGIFYGRAVV